MTKLRTCPWTGQAFEAKKVGAHEKVFADDRARAAAHKAARMFTEDLIAKGDINWDFLRHWWDNRGKAARPSYTTTTQPNGTQMDLPLAAGAE